MKYGNNFYQKSSRKKGSGDGDDTELLGFEGWYKRSPKLRNYNEFVVYVRNGTKEYYALTSTTSVPYKIDAKTYPDPQQLVGLGVLQLTYVIDTDERRARHEVGFDTVADMVANTRNVNFVLGQHLVTYAYNVPIKSNWTVVASGAGDMSDATLLLDNGLYAKLDITNAVVNVLEFGATGIAGDDQTDALQKALTFGQTIETDSAFVYYLPHLGDYEATHLGVDRAPVSRRITIAGDVPPNLNRNTTLRLTDTSQSTGFDWDSTMMAYNINFSFSDARSVGTLGDPRWTIDIRNVDGANSTADLDVQFIDCWMSDFHRGIKMFGRGFVWDGGSIVGGGGAASEGCLLDYDFPFPLEAGSTPDQTLVTGMRSNRIQNTRVHACTGYLLRNKGYNANNLYQFDFNNIFSDTLMGLVRGAVVNINVNGGTWLSEAATWLRVDSGFDFRNINLNGVNLLGMPEENVGEAMSGGTVTQAQVDANAQGVIANIPPDAGRVENFTMTGGIVSDVFSDCFQFLKPINGFTIDGTIFNNVCKENQFAGGTTRKVFAANTVACENVKIHAFFNFLDGQAVTTEIMDCPNVIGYDLNCIIKGNARETNLSPASGNYGGNLGASYCGTYVGDGSPSQRQITFSSTRYPKAIIVSQRDGAVPDRTWMAASGDSGTSDVRLVSGTLIIKADANLSGVNYSWAVLY